MQIDIDENHVQPPRVEEEMWASLPSRGIERDVRQHVEEGFFVLPSLLQPSDAARYSDRVLRHVKSCGERYKNMMNGMKSGGWYIGDLGSIDELSDIIGIAMRHPRLHATLSALLGQDYRLLSRRVLRRVRRCAHQITAAAPDGVPSTLARPCVRTDGHPIARSH